MMNARMINKTKIKTLDQKNFIWNFFGATLNSFNSFFFLIIVKWVNGINDAGIFTYAYAICCLFYFISMYFNRAYQVSDIDNKYSFNQYFTLRIFMSIISLILLLFFSMVSHFDIYKIEIIMLIMIFRTVEAICDLFYGQIQKFGYLYKTGISLSIKAVLGLIVFFVIDLITKNIILSLIGLCLINILIFIFYDKKILNSLKTSVQFDFSNIKSMILAMFPVFIFTFLQTYLLNCQKYVITYFVGNDIQTIFGILIMPATILCLACNYLITPFINELTQLYKNKEISKFVKKVIFIFSLLFAFGIVCIVIVSLIGIPVLNAVYNVELVQYKMLLLVIIFASTLCAEATIISNLLTIVEVNKIQSIIYLIVTVLDTIMSYYLIRISGISGAVYSYLITFALLLLLMMTVFVNTIKKVGK